MTDLLDMPETLDIKSVLSQTSEEPEPKTDTYEEYQNTEYSELDLAPDDVRLIHLDRITEALQKFANTHKFELTAMSIDVEDFVQTCLCNIFKRKGFEGFSIELCHSLETLVANCAKRQLIDFKRKHYAVISRLNMDGTPVMHVSLDEPVLCSEDSPFLREVVPGDGGVDLALLELANTIPDTRVTPNVNFTWKQLLGAYLEGKGELAVKLMFNGRISASRIKDCFIGFFQADSLEKAHESLDIRKPSKRSRRV